MNLFGVFFRISYEMKHLRKKLTASIPISRITVELSDLLTFEWRNECT